MNKLGAIDANFLYTETDLMPNHIGSVQKFAIPEGVSGSEWVSTLRDYVGARVHRVDYMHRKLQFAPGNLDHPMWVEAGDVNMEDHIVEVPVEAPGSMAQLEQAIATIHERRMDLTRPLWKMHVVTGLEDGTVAVYNQIHHAAIDGVSGQLAIMMIMDTKPEHDAVDPVRFEPEETGVAEQLHLSFENLLKYQLSGSNRMLGRIDAMRRLMQRAIDPSRSFGAFAKQAPRTCFNRAIGGKRRFAAAECDFAEMRAMSKQLGCSINDVFMAICAGGLRRYLDRKGELPASDLIAGCPVSLRKPGDSGFGNQVTMMAVDLATSIDDPKLRLLAISESAKTAKSVVADVAGAYDGELSLPGLPNMTTAATAAFERFGLGSVVQPAVNVVLSNVPGPREPLYFNGARMTTHYPVSIPAHGAGLNITVQSYEKRVYFGITACADAVPDADQLRDDLLAAFSELKQVLLPANNVAPLRTSAATPDVNHEESVEKSKVA